jgi:hypothetical protein
MSESVRRARNPVTGCWRLAFSLIILSACLASRANAGFVAPYDSASFTLFNSLHANGDVVFQLDGVTLVLTGPHDGSAEYDGFTDLTVTSRGVGLFRFHYLYTSLDLPGFDGAGYLLNGDYHELASASGVSGWVNEAVSAGDVIGFRVRTIDNQAEPGVLTVSDFSAPVPEPAAFWLTGIALATVFAAWRSAISRARSRPIRKAPLLLAIATLAATEIPVSAQTQVDYTGVNVTGELRFVRIVNLRQQAQVQGFQSMTLKTAGGEKQPKTPPARLRPPMMTRYAMASSVTLAAKSLSVASTTSATGFNALSHLDQRLAHSGNQFSIEPPSQSIAIGGGYVLEGVNNAVQVYFQTGAPALNSVVSSNQLFGLGPAIDWNTGFNGVYLTDMRVYFDQGIGRWFVVQRSQDNDAAGNPLPQSHLYLAVSRTSDPTGDYFIYVMDTTNASHPGCPCIADYPQIGSDQHGFHIAYNQFTSFYSFVDAAIMSVSKQALAAGAQAPTAFRFTVPFTTGYEFAIQPATVPPGASNFLASGGVEFLVSSAARFMSSSGIALWAMRNTSSLATPSPFPVLSRTIVSTLPYTFPDAATQPSGPLPYGSTFTPPRTVAYLDGGDNRVQSLTYAGARLYLTLQTGIQDEQGHWVVGGAYVVLSPSLRSSVLSAFVLNQGYLMVNGNHLLRPALAVNATGRGALSVTLVGTNWYPTAALIPFETFATPSRVEIAGLGLMPSDGFTGYPTFGGVGLARWGDYNGAVASSDGSIWMVSQYVGNFPRTPYANWNTFISRKLP